jgi:hypothetical protein
MSKTNVTRKREQFRALHQSGCFVGWGATLSAAEKMKAGSFGGLAQAAPGARLNEAFGRFT